MNFLLKMILNRFILSVLIIFFFLIDFKFLTLNPLRTYSLHKPLNEANEYYEVELGSALVYVYIHYDGSHIHLVPKDDTPLPSLTQNQPLIAWYYYFGSLALVNIIPFKWFLTSKKSKKKQK